MQPGWSEKEGAAIPRYIYNATCPAKEKKGKGSLFKMDTITLLTVAFRVPSFKLRLILLYMPMATSSKTEYQHHPVDVVITSA